MVKKIAVYGTVEYEHEGDVVQAEGRYEFYGAGRDLRDAVALAQYYVPLGYVEVLAEEFLKHPKDYGIYGSWIEWVVESEF